MKLRIRGNSIRFRLLQSEVERLGKDGYVSETTGFGVGNGVFTYSIRSDKDAAEVTARFDNNEICVTLPVEIAGHWIKTDEVGISTVIENGAGGLDILIEKDFVCQTRTDDPDQSDAYPHPDGGCGLD